MGFGYLMLLLVPLVVAPAFFEDGTDEQDADEGVPPEILDPLVIDDMLPSFPDEVDPETVLQPSPPGADVPADSGPLPDILLPVVDEADLNAAFPAAPRSSHEEVWPWDKAELFDADGDEPDDPGGGAGEDEAANPVISATARPR